MYQIITVVIENKITLNNERKGLFVKYPITPKNETNRKDIIIILFRTFLGITLTIHFSNSLLSTKRAILLHKIKNANDKKSLAFKK